MAATSESERRARATRAHRATEREFPPMIEYPSLGGLPVPVRFAVATAMLPLEITVTSVRLLKDVEALLAEVAVQLRSVRPAVAAMGEAYAQDHFRPLLDTVDDLRADTRAVAVIWAPFSAVRDVLTPERARPEPTVVPASLPPAPSTSLTERVTGWLWPFSRDPHDTRPPAR